MKLNLIRKTMKLLFSDFTKSWVYVDFKMADNENALSQSKFELGITGIIQNVFPVGKE